MPRNSFPMTAQLKRLIVGLAIVSIVVVWVERRQTTVVEAQAQPTPYRNFEAPQVHPLAITPDGTRLVAVNTPNIKRSRYIPLL